MKKIFTFTLLTITLLSWTTLSVDMEKRNILNDKVDILIPKVFQIMSEASMKIKYPSERRPALVYTDESGGINLAFNHTQNKASQEQIEPLKVALVSTFKNLYSSAEWKDSGIKEINGRKVGYMELVTPAVDTKIYNLIFFTDMDGRLLLCTFNCVEKKQVEWTEAAHQIMNSLVVR